MSTLDLIAAARALNNDLQDIDGVGYVVSDSVVAALHIALAALPPDPRVVPGEPTEAMVQAAFEIYRDGAFQTVNVKAFMRTLWQTMLRAAAGQDKEKADG